MIRLEPQLGTQVVVLRDDRFPQSPIRVTIPEWIAARDEFVMIGPSYAPPWESDGDCRVSGCLTADDGTRFAAEVTGDEDGVAIRITLTNGTDKTWREVSDFSCWNFGEARDFADFELLRTFVWSNGARKRVIDVRRAQSPRPLIQFYPVGRRAPFEENVVLARFESTCPETLDHGAIAIVSRDGKWTALVLGERPLFVFNNGEYSCIHSCPLYGDLEPGATAMRTTRLLIVQGTADVAFQRLKALSRSPSSE